MKDSLLEALEHMTGFVVVLMTLCILWGLTALMGKIITTLEARKLHKSGSARSAQPAPAPVPVAIEEPVQQDSDEEIAVIAATVSMMLTGNYRIVSIRAANMDWGREGRRQIFSSHKIR